MHEVLERRLGVLAAVARLDQAVQLGEHVLEPGDVLRREVLHALGHLPEVGTHHLFRSSCISASNICCALGSDEAVLLQLGHLARRVGGQRVEERLAHPGVVVVAEGQLGAFPLQDLVEPLADLLQRPGEVEHLLLLLATLTQTPLQAHRAPRTGPACLAATAGWRAASALPPMRISSVNCSRTSAAAMSGPKGSWVPSQREYRNRIRTQPTAGRAEGGRCPQPQRTAK